MEAVQEGPQEVAMAPKAKVRAMAKVKAKAKPKAKARVVPLRGGRILGAAAKAKAKAKAIPRRGRRLRRPAAADPLPVAGQEPLDRWHRGEVVTSSDIPLEELLRAPLLIVEDGRYFQGDCKVAGLPTGSMVSDRHLYVKLSPQGTTNESLLKLYP